MLFRRKSKPPIPGSEPPARTELERLERKFQQEPRSRAFFPLAEAYRRAGDLAAAANVLEEGLRHHPEDVGARTSLGRVYVQIGKDTQALEHLLQVVQRAPENVKAQEILTEIYERNGYVAEAILLVRRMLGAGPVDPALRDREQGLVMRLRRDPFSRRESPLGLSIDVVKVYLDYGLGEEAQRVLEEIRMRSPHRSEVARMEIEVRRLLEATSTRTTHRPPPEVRAGGRTFDDTRPETPAPGPEAAPPEPAPAGLTGLETVSAGGGEFIPPWRAAPGATAAPATATEDASGPGDPTFETEPAGAAETGPAGGPPPEVRAGGRDDLELELDETSGGRDEPPSSARLARRLPEVAPPPEFERFSIEPPPGPETAAVPEGPPAQETELAPPPPEPIPSPEEELLEFEMTSRLPRPDLDRLFGVAGSPAPGPIRGPEPPAPGDDEIEATVMLPVPSPELLSGLAATAGTAQPVMLELAILRNWLARAEELRRLAERAAAGE